MMAALDSPKEARNPSPSRFAFCSQVVILLHALGRVTGGSRVSIVCRDRRVVKADGTHAQGRVHRAAQRFVARVVGQVHGADARVRARQRVLGLVRQAERELVHATIEPLQLRKASDGRPPRAGDELQQLLPFAQREGAHRPPEPAEALRRPAHPTRGERVALPVRGVDVGLAREHAGQVSRRDELGELANDPLRHRGVHTAQHRIHLPVY
mmetsp:Transcript_19426/g.41843  ORF Transcript_19426/g.41843 Transcript_19426/m.41843 type:complete len:211 (-) Transcript_19426:880-1512(-)